MENAERSFFIQLLQAYLGETIRGTDDFAIRMHCVVDILVEKLELVGTPKLRHEVVYAVCYALAMRPQQFDLFSSDATRADNWQPLSAVFVVALVAEYDDVVVHILEHHPILSWGSPLIQLPIAASSPYEFGTPLDVMISLGRTAQVDMLLSHGAELSRCNGVAYQLAAKRGHADVVDLVVERLPSDRNIDTSLMTLRFMTKAVEYQQWEVVRRVLRRPKTALRDGLWKDYWNTVLCSAANHGIDDIVDDVLKFAEPSTTDQFPLGEAASGGHLSTCRLLLQKGIMPEGPDLSGRAEELARSVARGGNLEVCRLLKECNLWKREHEIHFLPIAAECGHLDFARYAVENGCDGKPKQRDFAVLLDMDRPMRYPEDIRYFALLRAVVMGHQDIVYWLIHELGVNVSEEVGLTNPQLCPVELAIHTNNKDMIKSLLSRHADSNAVACAWRCEDCWKGAAQELERYRNALRLHKDYSWKWYAKALGH
jgi:hypothetical protein